jgi:hypothetical protein
MRSGSGILSPRRRRSPRSEANRPVSSDLWDHVALPPGTSDGTLFRSLSAGAPRAGEKASRSASARSYEPSPTDSLRTTPSP